MKDYSNSAIAKTTTVDKRLEKPASGEIYKQSSFYRDVVSGLTSTPKFLPSKYFYDAAGDCLFQDIMNCGEYYPYRCELEIFSEKTAEVASVILSPGGAFDLIELGPGDATKSGYLLRYLYGIGTDFTYVPVDISVNIIRYLGIHLPASMPGLKMTGMNGEYIEMLKKVTGSTSNRKVILFLGSNLGNIQPAEAALFCREIRRYLQPGDLIVAGLDLKKNPVTVLAAYNDRNGITREFNLNLLRRINKELKADFNIDKYEHYPVYDPETGGCKSYLISLEEQWVTITGISKAEVIHFDKDEPIFMEISQKFTPDEVAALGRQAGFLTRAEFFDHKHWFLDTVWEAIGK